MGKKVALNVLYNIGIIVALYIGYWGFEAKHYAYIVGAVFIATIFVILKMRLIKEVRSMNKRP